ncbi:putative solute carrier family 26 member 6 isoform X6 [Penaeus vannamei]|uniref:Putative solute carrier family 26 member 6 isoform X6 n=1 Tax=Penaeus vannamei TaxID=6689 RepID=A0A423TFZ1_PENVA|nr:putative solute carrier family 26 member 6 isoform X6 [Penaeus vannamei]
MGSFAVTCLMTGKVVRDLATPASALVDGAIASNATMAATTYTPVQVATIVSFMVGVWELIMGLLQLGSLSVFLSEMLVSGFTTGAAFHVMTSQVKYLFGLKIKARLQRRPASHSDRTHRGNSGDGGLLLRNLNENYDSSSWAISRRGGRRGVTQMTTVISCALLLLVLLFVGPAFETLPNCVLSSVIVVALKGMFMQVNDLRRVWAISRSDALIWLASFLAVVLIDIDFGLLIGVVVSLFVLLYRGQKPSTAILGSVPNTDIYLDINKYSAAAEVPSVSIFHFNGPLHFANSEYFRTQLFSMTGLDPIAIISKKKALEKQQAKSDLIIDPSKENGVRGSTEKIPEEFEEKPNDVNDKHAVLAVPEVKWLVLDMSRISYLDSTGGKVIAQLGKEYNDAGIVLVLASVSESVLDSLRSAVL